MACLAVVRDEDNAVLPGHKRDEFLLEVYERSGSASQPEDHHEFTYFPFVDAQLPAPDHHHRVHSSDRLGYGVSDAIHPTRTGTPSVFRRCSSSLPSAVTLVSRKCLTRDDAGEPRPGQAQAPDRKQPSVGGTDPGVVLSIIRDFVSTTASGTEGAFAAKEIYAQISAALAAGERASLLGPSTMTVARSEVAPQGPTSLLATSAFPPEDHSISGFSTELGVEIVGDKERSALTGLSPIPPGCDVSHDSSCTSAGSQ